MKSWRSNPRIGLIALAPAAAAVLVLSSWHAHGRVQEIEDRAVTHARTLARQLASLTAPDVLAGNHARLESIVQAARNHYPAIISAAVTGRGDEPLAHTGRGAGAVASAGADDTPRVAIEQAIAPMPRARVDAPPGPQAGAPAGRLVLTVDLGTVRSQQSAVLLESAGIAGLTLLLAALLAVPIGSRRVDRAPRLRLLMPRRQGAGAHPDTRALQSKVARLERRNARLERARRAAEAASARKSRYVADVSHEIRTPMNAILGMTELLATEHHGRRQDDYIATMRDSARGLVDLLNGVLDVSKAEAGRLQLDYRDADVNDLLAEMFRLFAPQTFARGVELIVAPLPVRKARVRADAIRLKQVLVNLVSNAVRFTERGHVRIAAEPAADRDGRDRIRFTVEDTGCGIPAEVQPRLFDAFTQGSQAGRERAPALDPGTGLGLSIASELVGLMGSQIEFRSAEGAGSRFSFVLALEPAHAPAAVAAPGPRRRIALIDPAPVTREAHQALLDRAGIDVKPVTADDPTAVAERARTCDAIVVHVPASTSAHGSLPAADASLAAAGVPVLALVYEHSGRLRRSLRQAGYQGVIAKTADPAGLHSELEHALDGEPETPRPMAAPGSASGHRLLVVDDCPASLEIMRQYVRTAGFEPCTADSSELALRLAGAERFDAILIDLRLPGRDGAETARMLRDDGPNTRTPIIAVTADAFAQEAARARDAGIDDVLVKPVTRDDLLERLADWIPAARQNSSTAQGSAQGPCAPDRHPAGRYTPVRHPSDPCIADLPAREDRQPVLDPGEATRRAAGKPDLAQELFRALCHSLPQTRDALAQARIDGDTAVARAEAHRLRGAVLYCGVPRLEAAVAQLDEAARSDDAQRLDRALACIDACIGEVLAHADAHSAAEAVHGEDTRAPIGHAGP